MARPSNPARTVGGVVAAQLASPVGPLLAATTAEAVCLLEFADTDAAGDALARAGRRLGTVPVAGRHHLLDRLAEELAEYFAGDRRRFTVPLLYPGTTFQRRVWEALLRIPYGETRSYGDVAKALGAPGGQRAVGRANGQNRLAIVIPCHRVVAHDGGLGGYGGGLWRKRFLLELERGGPRQGELFAGD